MIHLFRRKKNEKKTINIENTKSLTNSTQVIYLFKERKKRSILHRKKEKSLNKKNNIFSIMGN